MDERLSGPGRTGKAARKSCCRKHLKPATHEQVEERVVGGCAGGAKLSAEYCRLEIASMPQRICSATDVADGGYRESTIRPSEDYQIFRLQPDWIR
jgi:hypothetical protein